MKSALVALVGTLTVSVLATSADVVTSTEWETSAVGTISGRVTLEPPPPQRRTARSRTYDGRSDVIQQLPAVVYLRGAISGGPSAARAVMTQRDTTFIPGVVPVMVGGTVEFPNEDPFFHNVFSYSEAKRLDLGRYPQGESKEEVFDEVGIVEVFCEVHREMRGAIIVTENPYHAVVDEDGRFTISGIPAGEHSVVFWSADHRAIERTINVTDGGTTEIEVELTR